jgi:hypothetical protein
MRRRNQGLDTDTIRDYLQRHGWQRFQVVADDPQTLAILTGWGTPTGGAHLLSIELQRDSQSLDFQVPGICVARRGTITDGELADLLMAITFSNFATRIGSFAYDPSDGEVRLRYSFPLDASTMSYEQFHRVLDALVMTTDLWAPRIAGIVEGERSGQSVIESFVGHLRGAGVM